MGFVLHDGKGYVCDLSSARGCQAVMIWLAKEAPSTTAEDFLHSCRTERPVELADEIDRLLQRHPPVDLDLTDVANALVRGLRRAHGYAVVTQ
ncbi:MAG: hypothetical protein JW395_0765 [Nitrospira sp.]|nr:hypothetical protein [Nitrospira sp.]